MNPNIRPDELSHAERILLDAGDIIRKRNVEHGHTERSFRMIAELWGTFITHAFTIRGETKLYPRDIATMMQLTKISRSVYGYSEDNFVDGAGYAALAAMLTPQAAEAHSAKLPVEKLSTLYPKPKIHKEEPNEQTGE